MCLFFALRQLVNLQHFARRLPLPAVSHLLRDMRGEVIFQKRVLHARKRVLHRLGLRDNLHAVTLFLYHPFDAAKLALNDGEPPQEFLLNFLSHAAIIPPGGMRCQSALLSFPRPRKFCFAKAVRARKLESRTLFTAIGLAGEIWQKGTLCRLSEQYCIIRPS